MREMFIRGGPIMWPLLLCSIVSLTVSIERGLFWWKEKRRSDKAFLANLFRRTEEGQPEHALSAAGGRTLSAAGLDFAARVVVCGLAHRDCGLKQSMDVAAQDEIERMKRGLGVLDTIVTMAPLLGILGTVLGIIASFDLLGQAGIENPKAVTGGIAQALITTAAGLTVALMTLVPLNYLIAMVQKATNDVNKLMVRLQAAYHKGRENHGDGQQRL